jgi:hypothetical protein
VFYKSEPQCSGCNPLCFGCLTLGIRQIFIRLNAWCEGQRMGMRGEALGWIENSLNSSTLSAHSAALIYPLHTSATVLFTQHKTVLPVYPQLSCCSHNINSTHPLCTRSAKSFFISRSSTSSLTYSNELDSI